MFYTVEAAPGLRCGLRCSSLQRQVQRVEMLDMPRCLDCNARFGEVTVTKFGPKRGKDETWLGKAWIVKRFQCTVNE